jgi:Holliday junction resolvasome RuvABC DNA-binding subunit
MDAMHVHYGGARVALSRQETKSLRLAEGIEDSVAQQMVVQVDNKVKQ